MPTPPVIGVTALNATDNPGPGVAVARALRMDPGFRGKIVGLAYDAMDPGLYAEGLFDATFLIPYPSAGRDALFERLAWIRERCGLDVLLPNLDSELPGLCGEEDVLEGMGICTFLPTRASFEARAKVRLSEFGKRFDLPTPETETVSHAGELPGIFERLGAPIVVKSPLYGAEICGTVEEAARAFFRLAAKWGVPILAQRYVRAEEYCVCCLGDGDGGLIGSASMKKLVITEQGKGWAGVTVADRSLLDLARRTIAALRWRGPCELEVLRDPNGGLNIVEINPRFPAWVDLTAGAGLNLPALCVRRALGEDVGRPEAARPGVAFVRISFDQIVPIERIAEMIAIGEREEIAEAA